MYEALDSEGFQRFEKQAEKSIKKCFLIYKNMYILKKYLIHHALK